MGLGKQAKTLTKGQVDAVLGYLAKTRWPTRNRLILLLSVKAGLRAKEIACLTWRMVTDARGQIGQGIHLEDTASKGRSGRVIPMNEELRTALREYAETIWMPTSTFLIQSERSRGMSPQAVVNLFWMVPARRLRRLFESQRSPHFHHQYREEDLDGRRVSP
jgi:integrase/recombinase XerD